MPPDKLMLDCSVSQPQMEDIQYTCILYKEDSQTPCKWNTEFMWGMVFKICPSVKYKSYLYFQVIVWLFQQWWRRCTTLSGSCPSGQNGQTVQVTPWQHVANLRTPSWKCDFTDVYRVLHVILALRFWLSWLGGISNAAWILKWKGRIWMT